MQTMMNDSFKNYGLESHTSPPLTLILTILLLVLFFVGFCTLYICRFFVEYLATSTMLLVRSPTTNMIQLTGSSGLDPSIVSLFPTFEYSSMKHLRQDKSVLECAVCLSEFEENDLLRLLTVCSHVFHRECIDLWLGSHNTCPVCRINLVPSQKSPEKSVGFVVSQTNPQGEEAREGSCSITINQDEEERKRIIERAGGAGENLAGGFGVIERPGAGEDMVEGVGGDTLSNLFMKSHSTGHSITRIGENDDRFTLRVPEDFKEGITRRHNSTQSCITFGDFSNIVTDQEGDLGHPPRSSNGELAKV